MAAPKTANIVVKVAGKDMIINHTNFVSLKNTRTAQDVSDKFELRIMDDDAYSIEAALLSGNNYISVSYIDDKMEVYKSFAGYVISMSAGFVDNRNMLTLNGLISTSVRDKYEKYSLSWNTCPKFDWADVLNDANANVVDANYEVDSGLDQFWQNFKNFFKQSYTGWKSLFGSIATGNWNGIADYKTVIDNIFAKDWLSVDQSGNYYIQKYRRTNDTSSMDNEVVNHEDEDESICKSTGSYVIPMRPHKLLKLICCGGKFSDLLEEEYTDYKGTAFYNNNNNLSEAEWYYIKKWFEKMGKFNGLGYSTFENNYILDWTEDEFIQTRQSFMDFIYKVVLKKCVQTKDGKQYTNFYLSFNEKANGGKGSVKLARVDASKQVKDAPQYIYYGRFKDDGKNKGRMTSFSPKLDILTSMITGGTVSGGKASNLAGINLVDSQGDKVEITQAAETKDEATEGRYKVNWGAAKVVPVVSYTANNQQANIDISKVFNDAQKLAYRASATIEGFNKLLPQDYIEIIVLPRNDVGTTTYHHYSGIYFILEIEDTIENGRFYSSLSLIKNIQNTGNTAEELQATADIKEELKYTIDKNTYINSNDSILENQMKIQNNDRVIF